MQINCITYYVLSPVEGNLIHNNESHSFGQQRKVANASEKMSKLSQTGVLSTKCSLIKLPYRAVDKIKVVCTYCNNKFCFHQNAKCLKDHLRAKHIFVDTSKDANSGRFYNIKPHLSDNADRVQL